MSHPAILKTDAIVLRISPYSRTSHVTTWLSPTHGRVTTVVKGACRPNSAFLGQYDLFTTCELLFYRRDHEGVHAIRECSPLETRDSLRADWRRICTASYLCDLTSRAIHAGQECAILYRLLGEVLDTLCAVPADADLILRYELSLLNHLGLMPQLIVCPLCHTPEKPWARFALGSGRVVCTHTGAASPGEPTVTIHSGAIDYLSNASRDACAAERTGHPPRFGDAASHLSLGSRRFLGIFIRFHLETPSAPRRLAFELLKTDPATLGRTSIHNSTVSS